MTATENQSDSPTASRTGWYSYAIVRIVPRVERGEQINAGVILFAPEKRFLAARIEFDPDRVRVLSPGADLPLIEQHLRSFQDIADGKAEAGPLAALPQSDRFHWLTAPRSTIIQTSPVHTGMCADPEMTLEDLLNELVRPTDSG
jgi:Protein of unknown function (DUF3037)